jgi:hypothetical protein
VEWEEGATLVDSSLHLCKNHRLHSVQHLGFQLNRLEGCETEYRSCGVTIERLVGAWVGRSKLAASRVALRCCYCNLGLE